ncbi:hypothetical protein [Lacisediminimonas profundi]|uniref:hypothetical protein n=1 Tax=Lacisediminimonas profundi TaxID=2603856 RepID=UPI00124B1A0C|nr:hypothetical protein [Lacisediminimonas profundi]
MNTQRLSPRANPAPAHQPPATGDAIATLAQVPVVGPVCRMPEDVLWTIMHLQFDRRSQGSWPKQIRDLRLVSKTWRGALDGYLDSSFSYASACVAEMLHAHAIRNGATPEEAVRSAARQSGFVFLDRMAQPSMAIALLAGLTGWKAASLAVVRGRDLEQLAWSGRRPAITIQALDLIDLSDCKGLAQFFGSSNCKALIRFRAVSRDGPWGGEEAAASMQQLADALANHWHGGQVTIGRSPLSPMSLRRWVPGFASVIERLAQDPAWRFDISPNRLRGTRQSIGAKSCTLLVPWTFRSNEIPKSMSCRSIVLNDPGPVSGWLTAAWLAAQPHLHTLRLNRIENDEARAVLSAFGSASVLRFLELDFFGVEFAQDICGELTNLFALHPHLKALGLKHLVLTAVEADAFARAFALQRSIRLLDIRFTDIEMADPRQLVEHVFGNPRLQELWLDAGTVKQCLAMLQESLRRNTSLERFHIVQCDRAQINWVEIGPLIEAACLGPAGKPLVLQLEGYQPLTVERASGKEGYERLLAMILTDWLRNTESERVLTEITEILTGQLIQDSSAWSDDSFSDDAGPDDSDKENG